MNRQQFRKTRTFGKGMLAGALAVAAFAAGLGMRSKEPPALVVGTCFKLVDDNGKVRGSWTVDKDGANFAMSDSKGRTRVGIVVKDGPVIKLWGEQGENAVLISQDENKGSWLIMFDQDGHVRLDAQVHRDAVATVLRGKDEKPRVSVKHLNDGPPELEVLDKTGAVVWTADAKNAPLLEKGK